MPMSNEPYYVPLTTLHSDFILSSNTNEHKPQDPNYGAEVMKLKKKTECIVRDSEQLEHIVDREIQKEVEKRFRNQKI